MTVEEAWRQVVSWCREHAPATAGAIRPPADPGAIRAAEAATGTSWPDELRTWYALSDGTERTPDGYVLPGFCPLPLASIVETWQRQREVGARTTMRRPATPDEEHHRRVLAALAAIDASLPPLQDDPQVSSGLEQAGVQAGRFLPAFVPFAEDQSGSYLFVDTRPGSAHGCVIEYEKVEADVEGPLWPSVSAMLADVSESLRTGRPIRWFRPVVEDGSLDWDIVDDEP